MNLIIIILFILLIERIFKPRVDITERDDVILWYNGKQGRIYKFLWKNDNLY
jgi:hypothetical protein